MSYDVSIILPVYNVEQYLEECLESIEQQIFTNYELIIVNDGSTDNSEKICRLYVEKHDNAKLISQKNQGLSVARNNGVSVSTGKYITFVDSDDVISNNYLSSLVGAIESSKADLSIGRSLKFWDRIPIKKQIKEMVVLSPENALIEMCNGHNFGVSACCKLYKRELVEKYPYPIGKIYEDLATTYKIIGDSKCVAFCKDYLYFYRQREQSISHSKSISAAQLYGLEAAENQLKYIRDNFPNAIPAAEARCVLKAFDYIAYISDGSQKSKRIYSELQKYVKENSKHVLKSKDVNMQNKIRCISIRGGYHMGMFVDRILDYFKKMRVKRYHA